MVGKAIVAKLPKETGSKTETCRDEARVEENDDSKKFRPDEDASHDFVTTNVSNLELRKIRIALTVLSSIPELYCLSAL